ncbi:type II secretion system F family protein [bacterium]|nr:type II secretion system F family protein [bacterium]
MPPLILLAGVGLLVVGGGFAVYLATRSAGQSPPSRLAPRAEEGAPTAQSGKGSAPDDPSPVITRVLDRLGLGRSLQKLLLQAGLLVRPTELVVLVLGLAGMGFAAGMAVRGFLLALVLSGVAAVVPVVYVQTRRAKRNKALVDQLSEALTMMASSLRSGYSFLRAMQVVSEEMDAPISEEFGRVLDEMNVGVSHERALKHLMDRCPSGDVELIVTACQIQSTVGGNLAEILDTTAGMIRERVRLQGEISALTAEGRLSASILCALPIFLAIVVGHLSPGYLDPLFITPMGRLLLLGAGGAMGMGMLVIKKMMAVQI